MRAGRIVGRLIFCVLAGSVLLLRPIPAVATDPPIAIIITNSAYDSGLLTIGAAAADGAEFRTRLVNAGFPADRVVWLQDPTYDEATKFAKDASARYAQAASFVVFYSGHGILYGAHARLIPKDFSFVDLASTSHYRSIEQQTVAVSDILKIAGSGDAPALFIFDACRDDGTENGTDFFSKLLAMELSRAAQQGAGQTPGLSDDRRGTFDNQEADDGIRLDPTEDLHRENGLVLLGAIRSKWGPGMSYAIQGEKLSELTSVLLNNFDRMPDRGVGELFAAAKPKVIQDTMGRKPPQVPHAIDFLYSNPSLRELANPPATAPATASVPTVLQQYAGVVATAQQEARNTGSSFVTLSPFELRTFTPNSVLAQLIPHGQVANILPALPNPEERATVLVSLVVRLWQASDRRVFGFGTGSRPVRIPSEATKRRMLPDGRIEFSQQISADTGYRLVSVQTIPTIAASLLDYRTERETDADGVLSETKIWHIASDKGRGPAGELRAELRVMETLPKGSMVRRLTNSFPLRADQHVALALSPEEAQNLDALEIQTAAGTVIAEIHRGDRDVAVGPLLAALQQTSGGLLLQLASP